MFSVVVNHQRNSPSLETNVAKSAFSSLGSYHTHVLHSYHDMEEISQRHFYVVFLSSSINFAGGCEWIRWTLIQSLLLLMLHIHVKKVQFSICSQKRYQMVGFNISSLCGLTFARWSFVRKECSIWEACLPRQMLSCCLVKESFCWYNLKAQEKTLGP